MAKVSHRRGFVRPVGFDEIQNHKPRSAQAADQLLVAVQVFHCSLFAIGNVLATWQRAFVVILAANHVLMLRGAVGGLQAQRRFVLADVKAIVFQNPGDFPVNGFHIRHVASADGLMHHIERGFLQHGKIIHRSLHHANGKPSLRGFALIQTQHARTKIHHRHVRPGTRIQNRLPTPARRQAKHVPAANIGRQPAPAIERGERVGAFLIAGDFGERAAVGQSIPRRAVFLTKRGHPCPPLLMCHSEMPGGFRLSSSP